MRYIKIIILAGLAMFFSSQACAEIFFSVAPADGSSTIRFGRIINEPISVAVRVNITSSGGTRYEVNQRLLDPLRNDQSEALANNAVTFYTAGGSNAHGTLYQNTPAQLDTLNRVIYSSSPEGSTDSFTIVYQVNPSVITSSGNFLGRILYSVRGIGTNASEKEVILNCYLEYEKKFDFEVTTSSHDAHTVRIAADDKNNEGYVQLKNIADFGGPFQITQIIEENLSNEKGMNLLPEAVQFFVRCFRGQSSYSSPSVLSQKSTLLYASDARGKQDEIVIGFRVDKDAIKNVGSGTFRGRFIYTIESQNKTISRIPINIQLEIPPVFEIGVVSQGSTGLTFQNMRPGVTVEKELVLNVTSNLKKPYTVVQKITSPLANARADTIPFNFLKVKTETIETMPGKALLGELTPVHQADTVLFASDSEGHSSRFIVRYSLAGSDDVKPGDYATRISYGLLEK
jgi:hypothetical protein